MTTEIVNTETGEILEAISADEARRLTTEAQNEFRSSREHFDRAWSLIEQAVEGGGHVALGYRSPGDYLHAEFDGVLSGLDVSSRRVAVKTMAEWGLSTRAIAKPLGVGKTTIERDIHQVSHVGQVNSAFISATDALAEMNEPRHAAGANVPEGERAATPPSAGVDVSENDGRGVGAPVTPSDSENVPARPPSVVGIDGKTYKRTEKKVTRRRPLTDAARDAGWELRKSVERLERIAADDRFAANKDQVAAHLRGHLNHAIEVCQDLLDRVNEI